MKIISSRLVSRPELVGGKGYHLQKLCNWGANVAPFFVVTIESYKEFKTSNKIPTEVGDAFDKFFEKNHKIVLRSSMVFEDNKDASFAGMFETILDVTQGNWKESLLKVWDSVNSPRVVEYLKHKKLNIECLMAVVVQKQIDVEKSGVLFTRSPIGNTSLAVIDAGFGLGEGVVSGLVEVDHFKLMRTGELVEEIQRNKVPVLSANEYQQILMTGLNLESKYGAPLDLEWGMVGNELYVFQIRPITRDFARLGFFVDTNLSESYPGSISPLGAKFVIKAYENVFTESATILGASADRLKKLTFHYKKLISDIDHHLYYDLEHYYAVLRSLPGGDKNIENWHRMIGGDKKIGKIPYHATELTPFESFQFVLTILKSLLNRKETFNNLINNFALMSKQIEEQTSQLKNSTEILYYANDLLNRPIGFGLTIINDLYVMFGLSYLEKICRRKGFDQSVVIDILKTTDNLDSVKPLTIFENVASLISDNVIAIINKLDLVEGIKPYDVIYDELIKHGFHSEKKLIQDFICEYGDRSFEELKLESLPIRHNPKLFMNMLTWVKSTKKTYKKLIHKDYILELGFFDKKVLHFTRDVISVRESTRLWRGKYYNLLRNIILSYIDNLQQEDSRFKKFSIRDFFSVSIAEWILFKKGTLSYVQVEKLIEERANWKKSSRRYPEFLQWVRGEDLPSISTNDNSTSSELSGQGVSSGEASGVALVLENPEEIFETNYKDYILVTKNTDPAWVYIMSRSKGLISEKGSLLSHTAIIGRELSLPTVVGVNRATQLIKTGDRIHIDGLTGKVTKI